MSETKFLVKKLNNGTPVLLANFKDSETITIGISYNVGGRNEWKKDKALDGTSHFLEHQFFKGNPEKDLSPQQVNEAFDGLGGMSNAFTTEDSTCYFVKCLSEEVFNSIDLWDKLLIFGDIDQKEFDKESFVVRQEFRRMEDSPPFLLYTKMKKKLHEGTSLEMDVIGNEESLETVTLKQMEDYRNEHYGLENAVVMVLGGFDTEKVYDKLNETFGVKEFRDHKPSYELTEYLPATESRFDIVRVDKETPLVFFGLGIKTPGGKSEDRAAVEILMSYITLGKSSLLQKRLVRPGICAFAVSFNETYEDVGNIILLAGTQKNTLQTAHEEVLKMFHEAFTMDVDQGLLDSIIERIEYDYRSNSEEPLTMMIGQADSYWRRGGFQSMEDRLIELQNVTLEKYKEVRTKILAHLKGVYGILGNTDDFTPTFPEGTWDGIFE